MCVVLGCTACAPLRRCGFGPAGTGTAVHCAHVGLDGTGTVVLRAVEGLGPQSFVGDRDWMGLGTTVLMRYTVLAL